jgi:hypothetical protein
MSAIGRLTVKISAATLVLAAIRCVVKDAVHEALREARIEK